MTAITETRTSDERGFMAELYKDGSRFAHYVFTRNGFARGGSQYSYDKEIKVCFGRLLCAGLPDINKARWYNSGATFAIPKHTPTLLIALEDFFTFTTYKGTVSDGEPCEVLQDLKHRINPTVDLDDLLKEFGIVKTNL